jgi:BirA family biotin operon repressor/biotin-[acetyl-CoA-carboxylase] ligase
LLVFDILPSTSDFCRERAEAGEPEMAVMARRQDRGRGKPGRAWVSVPGNLFLSVLLRPPGLARDLGLWALLSGVALAEVVEPLLPDPAALTLKWPNDLLLGGRKLAGVLIDSAGMEDRRLWLVIGIGLNLAAAPDVPGRAVASVADVAEAPAPEIVASSVLMRLDHWRRQDAASVRAAWLRRAPPLGAPMALEFCGDTIIGSFAGLAEDGSLLLLTDGRVRAFAAGEVSEG